MKKFVLLIKVLFIVGLTSSAFALDLSSGYWSSSLNCGSYGACDGMATSGANNTVAGQTSTLSTADNHPGGSGSALKVTVGDGKNIQTGTVIPNWSSPAPEIWVRWYMKYEKGFNWSYFGYDKLLYLNIAPFPSGGSSAPCFEFWGNNGFRLGQMPNGAVYDDSGAGWESIMGGPTSDGQWHAYEVHFKTDTNGSNGVYEAWVDGKKILSHSNVNFNKGNFYWFILKSNQNEPGNNGYSYVYLDDVAISTKGYIGPMGGSTPATTNNAPVLAAIGSKTVAENSSLVFTVSASDSNGDTLSYSASGLPSGATFNSSTRTFSWTPNNAQAGSYTTTFSVSDGKATDSEAVLITVTDTPTASTNQAPVLATIGSKTVAENSSLAFTVSASDSNGDTLSYSASGLPSGAAFNSNTRTFSWTPNNTQAGSYTTTFSVSDGKVTDSEAVRITVTDTPTPPIPQPTDPAVSGTVLFEENFESTNLSVNGWYDNTSPVLTSAQAISGSTKSLELRFPVGATKPVNGGSMRKKFSDSDGVYVSYYVKHSANWTGSDKTYHPHQFYLLTNKDSDWSGLSFNPLTTYIETNEGVPRIAIQDGVNIDQSRLNQNLTSTTEARSVAGCNGDSDGYGNGDCYNSGNGTYNNGKTWRAGKAYFTNTSGPYYKGDWHKVEAYIKLNSIANGKAVDDGIIQYWFDGEPVLNYTNVVFRTGQNADMKFNKFVIAPWIGDGSPVDQTFWVDNLTVSTAPPAPQLSPPKALRIISVQ